MIEHSLQFTIYKKVLNKHPDYNNFKENKQNSIVNKMGAFAVTLFIS